MIRGEARFQPWHGAVVALGVVAGLIVAAYVRGPGEPSPVASPTVATPAPAATPPWLGTVRIAGLVPVAAGADTWEETEAVRAIREFEVVSAWASLIGTTHFQQFEDLIDPSGTGEISRRVQSFYADAGPSPLLPIAVDQQADGVITVDACVLFDSGLAIRRTTGEIGEPKEQQYRVRYALSPVTWQELTALGDRFADYTSLRVRGVTRVDPEVGQELVCVAAPIVVQEFEGWQDHLAITVQR